MGAAERSGRTISASHAKESRLRNRHCTKFHAVNGTVALANVAVNADITTVGANGLDSTANAGLSTGTFYSAWTIFNPLTNVSAALLSTSILSPVMPSGYTLKARVGWCITDGSKNICQSIQQNDLTSMQYSSASTTMWAQLSFANSSNSVQPSTINGGSSVWAPGATGTIGIGRFVPPTAQSIFFKTARDLAAGVTPLIGNGSSLFYSATPAFQNESTIIFSTAANALPGVPVFLNAEMPLWSTNIYAVADNVLSGNLFAGVAWITAWRDRL